MKEKKQSREQKTLTNLAAIELLNNLAHKRRLAPLMRDSLSVSDLARSLGEDLKRCHYYVTRYQKLGLVTCVAKRKRRGRPSKLYRASADIFFVPKAYLVGGDTASVLDHQLQPILSRLNHQFAVAVQPFEDEMDGEYHYLDTHGEMSSHSGPGTQNVETFFERLQEDDSPPIFICSGDLQLSQKDAKSAQRELINLYKRLEQKTSPGEKKVTILLGISPVAG